MPIFLIFGICILQFFIIFAIALNYKSYGSIKTKIFTEVGFDTN